MGPSSSHSCPPGRFQDKSSGTVQKKLFTQTGGNQTTRAPDTYVNTTLGQHHTVLATVAAYGMAAFISKHGVLLFSGLLQVKDR